MPNSTGNIESIGICIGASTIKVVILHHNGNEIRVSRKAVRNHQSNPKKVLLDIFNEFEIDKITYGVVTGRKFRTIINTSSITELEATENALEFIQNSDEKNQNYSTIVSLGAETFAAYKLNNNCRISTVETGNKCASGTGEFFMQQIKRMSMELDEAVELALSSDIYSVSGRCSVFCKSDCTHALNKGVPANRVSAGLCRMIADKVLDLLEKNGMRDILAVGGVTNNRAIVNILERKIENFSVHEHADVFEALGAAFYAFNNKTVINTSSKNIFQTTTVTFDTLPAINRGRDLVRFESTPKGKVQPNDECIVGLDVGSTTTKAAVLRVNDNAVLASVYLRTNGDPVKASRQCYHALNEMITVPIDIIGLGTTGSGRQIAGLHASTDAIINEIIAHATGAAYFDKEVDTIFEIGGQDAKYTSLTNGVPSDYAMNEACSAGTGSFLEESAKESLGLDYKEIESVALSGKFAPNFNDQCAAFISSDIKTAIHEGISKTEIVAGLVYSICMNYTNRVKGIRPVGKKIFMQGGVCYNKAVPIAMAHLIEKEIIVPPDPGLIGAFGVALETKERIHNRLLEKGTFNLRTLAEREITYGKKFECRGVKEKCDRKCEINVAIINNKKYTFGGVCNKYYNITHHLQFDSIKLDLVDRRQSWVYNREAGDVSDGKRKKIGISRSYLTNTFYPLYHTFFTELGMEVVLSDGVSQEGINKKRSSFCYPGEIAHGCYANLLSKNLDYIFIPKIMGLRATNSISELKQHQSTCVLLQSESYYIKAAFKDIPDQPEIISPLLDFSKGYNACKSDFANMAEHFGIKKRKALIAYGHAVKNQQTFIGKCKESGKAIIREIESNPNSFAVVLFGRSYNAFSKDANMGIPAKFTSRGLITIPYDFLPFENEYCDKDMCWAIGQDLMKAAAYVKLHPQLYGVWVTNFSCGPDSFLLSYFRDIMKSKPSLTLELDSHTADAGVNTRIEAFIDIIKRYREIGKCDKNEASFTPAKVVIKKKVPYFLSSDNIEYSFFDKKVHLVFPSVGKISSEMLAASLEGFGVRSSSVPVYDYRALKLGRANTLCKECLPLQLTIGGLLKYIEDRKDPDEMLAFFMPFTPGNCRFPQYSVFFKNTIAKKRLKNTAIFSLNAEKGYMPKAFSSKNRLTLLKSFITADVMEDIKNALSVLAVDKREAHEKFETELERITNIFRQGKVYELYPTLISVADRLSQIELRYPLEKAKVVSLTGEIFVRRDYFSVQDLIARLAQRNIIVKKSHFFEYFKYTDHMVKKGIYEANFTLGERIQFQFKQYLQAKYEHKIKRLLAQSGLFKYELIDIPDILDHGQNFFDIHFRGESILVLGNFFREMLHSVHGVISIGPFACMPTRVIESILSAEANNDTMQRVKMNVNNGKNDHSLFKSLHVSDLPFLSIETDGNPFPQVLEAKIEAFSLQVERLHANTDPEKVPMLNY